jgi:hypothetical protein
MRATEFITEAFDKPFDIQYDEQFGPKELHARAYDRQGGYIDINFVPVRDNITDVEFSRNDSFETTGTGDEHRVFATVIEAFKHYLKGYKPKVIIFSGKGEGRGKLYQSLINRFINQVGYKQFDTSKLSPEARTKIAGSGSNVFVLRKNTDMDEACVSAYGGNGRWMGKEFYRHLV